MRNFSSKKKGNSRLGLDNPVVRVCIGVGVAVCILLLLRGVLGSATATITTPLYGIRTWFIDTTAAVPAYFGDRTELVNRIARLETDAASAAHESERVTHLQAENTRLREQLGGGTTTDRIAAGVIARPPFLPYDALLLDRGERSAIQEGAVVYSMPDIAIGTVARVYPESSLVRLFSTPGTETTVYIVGPNIYTTAYGEGGGVVRVSVPQGITLTEGDLVITPSLRSGIVGSISGIQDQLTKPEQDGYVVATALQSLHTVSVDREVIASVRFEEARENIAAFTAALTVDVPADMLIDVGTSTATSTATTTEVDEE